MGVFLAHEIAFRTATPVFWDGQAGTVHGAAKFESIPSAGCMQPKPKDVNMQPNEELDADRWQEWYRLSPLERWSESMKLWEFYLAVGGSLDPEPDSQSPFDAFMPRGSAPADGRSGLRVIRRGGV